MSEINTSRTTELIAAEIVNIKEQTKKMVIYNSIEIGRRLVEAKEIIEHGEWGIWVEKSVSYSQSTANNLMKIFNEYGSDQITLLNNNSKSQALGNLSYTQAVTLFGIPAEERESFVAENDIESMSTRELKKAIQDKEKAEKEKEEFKNLINTKSEEVNKLLDEKMRTDDDMRLTDNILQETLADFKKLQVELQIEKDSSKKVAEELEKNIMETDKQLAEVHAIGNSEEVEGLRSSLLEVQNNMGRSTQIIDELEVKLKASQNNDQSIIRFKIYCEELQEIFSAQLELIDEIKRTNPESYKKCKDTILSLLIKYLNDYKEKLMVEDGGL